jgi:TPP-dependent pyruvate/acetoin dehydrogenase alpha subunit
MWLIRVFEERAAELFQQGVIVGTAHSCVGQEAIAVGAAGVMREGDYLVGHHRSHGHLIAAGADIRRMMAEMFGRRTGYCKGLGGSMHIADMSLNILGCNGIVGAGLPHACGAGLTAKLRSTGQATLAFFGDGAAGQERRTRREPGRDLEAPGRLICENNQFAPPPTGRRFARSRISPIARAATGMPGDRRRQRSARRRRGSRRALDLARAGDGPTSAI